MIDSHEMNSLKDKHQFLRELKISRLNEKLKDQVTFVETSIANLLYMVKLEWIEYVRRQKRKYHQ